MKITQKALLLLVFFVCFAHCQPSLSGYSFADVRTGNASGNCFFRLYDTPESNQMTIKQGYVAVQVTGPELPPEGCIPQNMTLTSMFKDENPLTPPPTILGFTVPAPNVSFPTFDSNFYGENIFNLNGTACAYLPQNTRPGLEQYLCRFMYAETTMYWAIWSIGNVTANKFDNSTESARGFLTDRRNTRAMEMHSNVIRPNSSFPVITADLYDSCGNGSSVIHALSNQVTVTSTTDLMAHLSGMWMAYALIKKNSAFVRGDYHVAVSPSNASLFDNASNNNNSCWNMGVKFSDILPDAEYCNGGCQISFVLMGANSTVYVMETNGIATFLGIGGSTGGNSTGNNNTSGNNTSGNNNSTGTGNNNNNAANSALSMAFNAVLVVISVAYLAL